MKPIEVWPRLYVGNEQSPLQDFAFIVQAAKEPWHRAAIGYKTAAAPKGQDYLWTYKENKLILNLVDPNTAAFIPVELMVNARLDIAEKLAQKTGKVLIQCNKGESRAPSIALTFMYIWTDWATKGGFYNSGPEVIMKKFKKLYPPFNPSSGFTEYLNKFLAVGFEG